MNPEKNGAAGTTILSKAVHTYAQEWLSYISKISRKILTTKNKDQTYTVKHFALTHLTENIHLLAAGSGEEGLEQEDMAYRGLVAFSIPKPGPQHNPLCNSHFCYSLVRTLVDYVTQVL